MLPYDITKGNTAARSSYAFEQLYYGNSDSIYDMVPGINVSCSTSCRFLESPVKHGIKKYQGLYSTKNTISHQNGNTFANFCCPSLTLLIQVTQETKDLVTVTPTYPPLPGRNNCAYWLRQLLSSPNSAFFVLHFLKSQQKT